MVDANAVTALGIKQIRDLVADSHLADMSVESSEEVISRLKFIGHIQKEEKIDTRHVNRQPNTLVTKVYRTLLYPDNRGKSLEFIRDVISRTFEIIELQLSRGNASVCKSIITDLVMAKKGIVNLKHTYSDDTKFCCDMDVVIEQIGTKLSLLQTRLPDLFDQPSPKIS